jgi:hypothetical protein
MGSVANFERDGFINSGRGQVYSRQASSFEGAQSRVPWGFPEFFAISQTAFPALLYLPGTQALRLPLRIAAFGISLAALLWWLGHRRRISAHPAMHWLALAIVWLGFMTFHPSTNTALAGVGQTLLYLSVLAPLFWASAMVRTSHQLVRLLAILLICNGINSIVGLLQVYAPGTFMPQEFSSIVMASKAGLANYTYVDSFGKLAIRPPGLFDTPGTVCAAGMLAALLGFIFAVTVKRLDLRLGALLLGIAGVAAVYLSQVRTALLIMCGCMAVYVVVLWWIQKRVKTALAFLAVAVALITVLFFLTVARTGKVSQRRYQALTASDPMTVYYDANRGNQLAHGFTELLPSYPLGAGLARWGMMRIYFGDETNLDSPPIWSELQFNAWILDGGVILVCLYCLALVAAVSQEIKIARTADPKLRLIACIIIAANVGTLALIFGFTPFTTQLGMQYWFLTGALYGVAKATGQISNERIRTG